MVDADIAADLVVEAYFTICCVIIACELDAIHAEVGVHDAGVVWVFGVNLGEEDKGAAVVWPALDLGELVDGGGVFEGRARVYFAREGVKGDVGEA